MIKASRHKSGSLSTDKNLFPLPVLLNEHHVFVVTFIIVSIIGNLASILLHDLSERVNTEIRIN